MRTGIHSIRSEFLLGELDMSARAFFAGCVAYRGLVPMEKAVEGLVVEYAQNSMLLCGPDTLHPKGARPPRTETNLLSRQSHPQLFRRFRQDLQHGSHGFRAPNLGKRQVDLARRLLSTHPPLHRLGQSVPRPHRAPRKLQFNNVGHTRRFAGHIHHWPRSDDGRCRARLFQGQGAEQAIEDVLVLETLFGRIRDPKYIGSAFAAYDFVWGAEESEGCDDVDSGGVTVGTVTQGFGVFWRRPGRGRRRG